MSEWTILTSEKVTNVVLIYLQIFVVFEFIAYVIIFCHLSQYNEDMKKEGNQLGLSNDVIRKRKRCNIISFGGQFFSFIVEIVTTIVFHIFIVNHDNNTNIPALAITGGTVLILTYFIASPELRRFYFTKNIIQKIKFLLKLN